MAKFMTVRHDNTTPDRYNVAEYTYLGGRQGGPSVNKDERLASQKTSIYINRRSCLEIVNY